MTVTIFDFDGTFYKKNSITLLRFIKKLTLKRWQYYLWSMIFFLKFPKLVFTYYHNSADFNYQLYSYYKGISKVELDLLANTKIVEFFRKYAFAEALSILDEAKRLNHHILVVSGNLKIFLDPFFAQLGVSGNQILANSLEISDELYSGKVIGTIIDDQEKAVVIKNYILKHNLQDSHTIAYGNSHWDIPMLTFVKKAYCVNPNKMLERWARKNNIEILRWN